VSGFGVIGLDSPPPGSSLWFWTVLNWPSVAAVDLSRLSCTIQQSNFIGPSGDAVFSVAGTTGLSTIDSCYIAAEAASLFIFDATASGVKVIGCFFSGELPLMISEDPRLSGSQDNSGNCQIGHGFGHFEMAPCEVPDGSSELLCTLVECQAGRISREAGSCVTISGCSFSSLYHDQSGGAVTLGSLSGTSVLVDLTFLACRSDSKGGAVFVSSCDVRMQRLCGSGCQSTDGGFAGFMDGSSALLPLTALACSASYGIFRSYAATTPQASYVNCTSCSAPVGSAFLVTSNQPASHVQYLTVSQCTGNTCIYAYSELVIDLSLFHSATTYTFATSRALAFDQCYFDTVQDVSGTGSVSIVNSFFIQAVPSAFGSGGNVGNFAGPTPNFGRMDRSPCQIPDGRIITASTTFEASKNFEASASPHLSELPRDSRQPARSAMPMLSARLVGSAVLSRSVNAAGSQSPPESAVPPATAEIEAPLPTQGFTRRHQVYQAQRWLVQTCSFVWIMILD
jgi:hypothetical protein